MNNLKYFIDSILEKLFSFVVSKENFHLLRQVKKYRLTEMSKIFVRRKKLGATSFLTQARRWRKHVR